jgi:hypothetical protein
MTSFRVAEVHIGDTAAAAILSLCAAVKTVCWRPEAARVRAGTRAEALDRCTAAGRGGIVRICCGGLGCLQGRGLALLLNQRPHGLRHTIAMLITMQPLLHRSVCVLGGHDAADQAPAWCRATLALIPQTAPDKAGHQACSRGGLACSPSTLLLRMASSGTWARASVPCAAARCSAATARATPTCRQSRAHHTRFARS